jgi:hypothetical protein
MASCVLKVNDAIFHHFRPAHQRRGSMSASMLAL